MRNIFPEKSYAKCSIKTSPKHFFKKSKLSISLDQQYKDLYSLFLLNILVEGYRTTSKLRCRTLAFKAFLKNKKRSGTSFDVSFSA